MVSRSWLWCHLVLVCLVQGALASVKNFTIDDANDSIQYLGNWNTKCPHLGALCIDTSQAHNKTVHWNWPSDPNSSPISITIRFSGTAVYVYNVLADIPVAYAPEAAVANIAFTLDGMPVEPYKQPQGSGDSPKYLYHQLVFMTDNLSNGTHELVIIGGKSLVLFDYIKYTSEFSGSPPAMESIPSPSTTLPSPSLTGPLNMHTSTSMTSQHTTVPVAPPLDASSPIVTNAPTSATTGVLTFTTTDTTTAIETPSSKAGSSRSAGAIAGGVVGSVLAVLLLGVIALYARKRLSTRRVGKGMGRLLDEGPPPLIDNADHFASSRGQFLRPTYPALRPSPDVPRSPGYTMSSMPTSPTSYGGEPPSRTYMNDGTVARILEKADRARTEWPSSTGTRAFPAAFGTMERW